MSPATPQQIAQWQAWLAEAQLAYHALMTGRALVEVAVDGATYVTKFARPDAAKLDSYIRRLQAQIDAATNGCGPALAGAIGAYF